MSERIYARRHVPARRVKVNKAGAVSVLSIIRHLGLSDRVEFDVEWTPENKIVLTPRDPADVVEVPQEAETVTNVAADEAPVAAQPWQL